MVLDDYSTNKEVKLLDRRLGILHLIILLLVLGYVIGVRVVLEKGYQTTEIAYGMVAVSPASAAYTLSDGVVSPVDEAMLVLPGKEGDALFVPTVTATTKEQKMDNCSFPTLPCSHDTDCVRAPPLSYGLCTSGACVQQGWCPHPLSAASGTSAATMPAEALAGVELSVISTISFPRIAPNVLTTEDGRNAKVRWTLLEVLQRANVDAAAAVANGAVLSLVIKWSCNVGAGGGECRPRLKVYDIGRRSGFSVQWADYYQLDNPTPTPATGQTVPRRDFHNATGIRLLVTSRGVGRKFDVYACVLQLFVMLALLPISSMLSDTIMQFLFSERRHYREYKTETTPDFSDVRAKVDQLEQNTKSQQEKMMAYTDEGGV